MSRLLINENPLQVLPTLACAIGLNEAMILQQVHYWMSSSRHIYDGRHWVYNSVPNWQKQFPFWSESTVKRALLSLERQGLMMSANYNRDPRDQSKWYSINYDILAEIEQQNRVNDASGQFDPMEQTNMTRCNEPDCTDAQGQSEPMRQVNMTRPLPETTTETTQEITTENTNTFAPSGDDAPAKRIKNDYSAEFETAWANYPKREGSNSKPAAFKCWNARLKTGVPIDVLLAGVARYAKFCQAKGQINTVYVMQATRFFGPGCEYENPWSPMPPQPANNQKQSTHTGFANRDYGTTTAPFMERFNK